MGLLLIATLCGKSAKDIIGYRILDTNTGKIQNVPTHSLIQTIAAGKATVDNIKVEAGVITGTNGALDRYPKCNMSNKSLDKGGSPLVVINRIGDIGYTVVDYKGDIRRATNDEVIAYADKAGIANGKVVTNDNKKFISAIFGTYNVIQAPDNGKTEVKEEHKPPKITEVPKIEPSEPPKVEDNILNSEQQMAVARYYQYYQNRAAQIDGTTDKAKETSKKEVEIIKELVKNNRVESNNIKFASLIGVLYRINDEEKLGNILNPVLVHSMLEFIKLGLPLTDSMGEIFREYMFKNMGQFADELLGEDSVAARVYRSSPDKNFNAISVELSQVSHCSGPFKYDIHNLKDLNNKASKLEIYSAIVNKLIEALQQNDIKIPDFIEWCENYYYKTALGISDGQSRYYDFTNEYMNKLQPIASRVWEAHLKTGGDCKYLLGMIVSLYIAMKEQNENGIETTTDSSKTLENMFNEAYSKRNEQGEDVEKTSIESVVEQSKSESNSEETSGGTSRDSGDEPTDPMEVLKKLAEENPDRMNELKNNISVSIALDILNRKLSYKSLSHKQKFRVDDAIKTISGTKSFKTKPSGSKAKATVSDEENESFLLSTNPDIKNNVDRIISKANSVEMQAVLKETPNVIKICYSIVRYGKASTRQLRHVNKAIEILDSQ